MFSGTATPSGDAALQGNRHGRQDNGAHANASVIVRAEFPFASPVGGPGAVLIECPGPCSTDCEARALERSIELLQSYLRELEAGR